MPESTTPQPAPEAGPLRVPDPAAPASKPSRPWKPLLLIAVVLSGSWLGFRYWSQRAPAEPATPVAIVRTTKVTVGLLERRIRLTGQTSSLAYSNITAPIMRGFESGREMILLFLVKSGARLKKGDLLAQIDTVSMLDHVEDIKDTIESAQADIRKRFAEQSIDVENLVQSLRVAKSEMEKSRLDVKASELRTSIDQELMQLAAEEAEARFNQLLADVQSKKEGHKAEVRILEITLERHERHLGRHATDIDRYTISSPMDGLAVVQSTFRGGEMTSIQQGDQVMPGQMLIKVVDVEKMQVEAAINQAESGLLKVGQTARIQLDAFGGLQLPGRIFSINAMAVGGYRQNFYIRNVPVRIRIEGADPRLIPDLSASVDVLVDRLENARQLPLAALHRDGSRPVVYLKRGQTFEMRPVTLGLQNSTHVAILSGLEGGEDVALDPPISSKVQVAAR